VRHLDDLKHRRARGLVWKPVEVQRVVDFFSEILVLPEDTASDEVVSSTAKATTGTPFVLQPFQVFIVGSLMGWYTRQGYRRFRDGYLEIAKANGKTPVGAGLMLYLLVADGERGAQVYFAAVTREQARLAFADAEKMVQASPHLHALITKTTNNLAVVQTGSFLRAISSEKRGLDGKRVHGALIDELHEHPSPVVVSKMRRGTKGRRNALVLRTTNSGFDRTSVCWHQHQYSVQVLEGSVRDDAWFAYISGLDPCVACQRAGRDFPSDDCEHCDSWQVEGPHWIKANPNLGVSLSWQYLRELVRQARGMPSAVSDLLRFNFCVWTQHQLHFLDMAQWYACPVVDDAELVGVPCYGGLDLGQSDDLCAFVLLFLLPDGRMAVRSRFWLPSAALQRYPDRDYDTWRRLGHLTVTDGTVTDYQQVEDAVSADCIDFGVLECAFDKRFANQMAQNLMGQGITMVDMPQGFFLNEALRKLSDLVADTQLAHGHNPILTVMAANAVVRNDRNKTIRLDKDTAAEKIDGISALAMAIGRAIAVPPEIPADDPVLVIA
jgi:phage terminase large subunit-like protein